MEIKNQINTVDELKKAITDLGCNTHSFSELLSKHGIEVSKQAVWKWTRNKTHKIPCYIGYFLRKEFGILKQS